MLSWKGPLKHRFSTYPDTSSSIKYPRYVELLIFLLMVRETFVAGVSRCDTSERIKYPTLVHLIIVLQSSRCIIDSKISFESDSRDILWAGGSRKQNLLYNLFCY